MSPGPGTRPLSGSCRVPSDKAISHRAAILGAMAAGTTRIGSFSPAGDCQATLGAIVQLGAIVVSANGEVQVRGGDFFPIAPTPLPIDCNRSGTTMRLLAGVAAATPGPVILSGHQQLLRRPMERVARPLRLMGAVVRTKAGGLPPLEVEGGDLRGISVSPEVASAQVKSAILLAALRARGLTTVLEPIPTRDHTEKLLAAMGADIVQSSDTEGTRVELQPGTLEPLSLEVPGDPSSAAVLACAAALVPGSQVTVEQVSANPTRSGFLFALARMGALIELEPITDWPGPEPAANVRISHRPLVAISVSAAEVPSLIDELPLLGLLGTMAEGTTEVHGAAELRVKESDRISALVLGLRALGAEIEESADGFAVHGPTPLHGGICQARSDHRLAMTFSLAALIAAGEVQVDGAEFVADSFPGFAATLAQLR